MSETSFYHWRVRLDPERTRRAADPSEIPDAAHCNACAVFLALAARGQLPRAVVDLLAAAGADLRQPQEVWGAPDGGFLNAWWVFAGELVPGAAVGTRSPPPEAVELAPGVQGWLTADLSMARDPAFGDGALVQLECVWQDEALIALERSVWPPEPRVGSAA